MPQLQDVPLVPGYRLADRTASIATWHSEQLTPPKLIRHCDRWQEITLPDLRLHHVYLSPHSSTERRQLLIELADRVERNGRSVVVGDFNLEPRPDDGWFGHEYSTFTSRGERVAFARLLNLGNLCDATESMGEYTVERMQNGGLIRWRW